MPHHVYHTRALVMKARASGEADMTLELFTKDWGRISTHARSLRKETSRLRFILQPMSWANTSVVRGASGWKLTTANPDDPSMGLGKERISLARIARIVQKFLPHETPSPRIFQGLLWHTQMLRHDPSRASDWEIITLARLFEYLGYWGIEPAKEDIASEMFSKEQKMRMVTEINRILRTVHT